MVKFFLGISGIPFMDVHIPVLPGPLQQAQQFPYVRQAPVSDPVKDGLPK
jgi:hypothetical protein